jgi:uncharacterized protein YbjT (DUF2867 family)
MDDRGVVVVIGGTGRQGGAVTRALLAQGWPVRAMSRRPEKPRARALVALGADVVRADMEDPGALDAAFAGAYGVYSVQSAAISGPDGEVRQGRNVADAAHRAGIGHLVYGSSRGERGVGVQAFESKGRIEDHLRDVGLPVTVLRPTAFMELMTDKDFFPAAGMWEVWPKLAGWDVRIPWLSCHDLGVIAERVFADPDRFIGRELALAAEVRSLRECRDTYTRVMGRAPRRFPMPVWLFERFAADIARLWRWTRTADLDVDTSPTRTIHPDVLTVEAWLRQRKTAPLTV